MLPDNSQLPADMRLGVVSTPQEAHDRAEFLFAHGVDFLKLIATGAVLAIGTEPGQPELTEDEMRAAVDVAKEHGSFATAHAHGAEGIKSAIRAGVRSIEHASLIDDEGLQMAKDHGVWLVMDVYNGDYINDIGTKEGWPEEYLRKNRETTDIQRDRLCQGGETGGEAGLRHRCRGLSPWAQRAAIRLYGALWHDPAAGDPRGDHRGGHPARPL